MMVPIYLDEKEGTRAAGIGIDHGHQDPDLKIDIGFGLHVAKVYQAEMRQSVLKLITFTIPLALGFLLLVTQFCHSYGWQTDTQTYSDDPGQLVIFLTVIEGMGALLTAVLLFEALRGYIHATKMVKNLSQFAQGSPA